MLHILFLILKIIGIILLAIIGIVVVLGGIVLFVPIRYRIKMETTNGLKGLRMEAKATWLLRLISAFVVYQDGELDGKARIAWKKFDIASDADEKKEMVTEQVQECEENSKEKSEMEDAHNTEPKIKPTSKKSAEADSKKIKWFKKIKCTIKLICDKIKHVKDFITEETHLNALLRLKRELVYFAKNIIPDKMKGYVRFGLDDPYNTGRVLALLSVLYPFYGKDFEIYPEFEREIIEADMFIKGRIHLIHLLIIICKVYFDNNVKVAYKNLKSLKG